MSIKKTIAVVSGKGGVGKSTITALLATKMSRFLNIGILDADIYGPNQAILLDVQAKQVMTNDGLIQPIKVGDLNMYLSTIAFFLKLSNHKSKVSACRFVKKRVKTIRQRCK